MTTATLPDTLADEGLVHLSVVAGRYHVHTATLTRWCLRGYPTAAGRVRMEHVRVGQRIMTSLAAAARFVSALTNRPGSDTTAPPRTPTQRDRASSRADADLAGSGW